jgi:uncharacterized protein YndB with AHSA1/START domain
MPAKNASASAATPEPGETTDRELVFTRTFDAPRELVFDAWTNPKHIPHWWGPLGFTTTVQEMDVRPGGNWRLVMRGPDGTDYKNRIVFLEVIKPERLVYKHEPEQGTEAVNFETTVTFTAQGDRTELTMRMLFPSAAAREHVVTKYGAVEGAKQTLGRLAGYLPQLAGGNLSPTEDLVIERIFDASPGVVFQAWTDPVRVQRWWGPKNFTNPVCEFDARPGGAIRIHMRAPNGVVYPMSGVVQEIVAPERLVFRSAALDGDGQPLFEMLNTVTFSAHEGKTRLTVRVSVLRATAAAAPHLAGAREGWSQMLDRLKEETERMAQI